MSARPIVFILLLTALCNGEESKRADEAQLKRWVAELGADDFETRSAAFVKLKAAGIAAIPALEAGKESRDFEIQSHVLTLLLPMRALKAKISELAEISERLGSIFGADLKVETPLEIKGEAFDVQKFDVRQLDALLAWLAKSQEDDGHWNSIKHGAAKNADVEQTALALLAFSGCGYTEKVGEFKPSVRKAVAWLIGRVGADGGVRREGEKDVDALAHALAGTALAEAAGMANVAATRQMAQAVVDYTCEKIQCGDGDVRGGFGREAKSTKPDIFTTMFFVMQLKSAKVAGLKVPAESFNGVIRFLDAVDLKEKGFGLTPGAPPSIRATAMGLLCRQFLGWKREDLDAQAKVFSKAYCDPAGPGADELTNWIGALVTFQQGGTLWQDFKKGLFARIQMTQPKNEALRGSIDPKGEWQSAGRIFSTAIYALCFEMRFRQ